MTLTLHDLTYRVAREISNVREGVATGGSTTTIADTANRKEPDDYWNGGTAWIIKDSAEAAPQGEYSIISDFVNTGGVVTLLSTLTAAVGSGDRYALANRRIPSHILEQSVNRALQDMGNIPVTDITTLDTVSNQTEYSLPIAANTDLRQVWVETNLNDTDDYRWQLLHNWYIQRTATGSSDLLVFPYQLTSGYDFKLVYIAPHGELYSSSSQLSESIQPERVIYKAAHHALSWLYRKSKPRVRESIIDELEKLEVLERKYEVEKPIIIPQRTGKIVMAHTRYIVDEGGPDRVVLG